MFSGIIHFVGKIVKITKNKLVFLDVESPSLAKTAQKGDSLAVDGVCLTVVRKTPKTLQFQVMSQTQSVTNLKNARIGTKVNLEKALKMSDYLDGHLLMGHVDGTAKVKSILGKKNIYQVEFKTPEDLRRFIALRGGIAINGVSLTVSHLTDKTFSVSLIEYTLSHTNLSDLKVGDIVNLEVDMVGRYLDNLLKYQNPRGKAYRK